MAIEKTVWVPETGVDGETRLFEDEQAAINFEIKHRRILAVNQFFGTAMQGNTYLDSASVFSKAIADNYDRFLDDLGLMEKDGFDPRVDKALEIIESYGGIDGGHHKTWVIDQVVRALVGERYAEWVAEQKNGEDGPDTYEWDEGIAP